MTFIPQTPQGFAPFEQPVPIPGVAWDAPPLICIQINEIWATYLMGACFALMKRSTWDTTDETAIRATMQNALQLQAAIAAFEACPMPVQFRVNPADTIHWQYSLDSGATWLDGPNTTIGVPDTSVITDPSTDLRNLIDIGSGTAEGLVIQGLAQIGVRLQHGGVAAFFQKIPGLGLAADAVEIIAGGGDYTYPLLELILP